MSKALSLATLIAATTFGATTAWGLDCRDSSASLPAGVSRLRSGFTDLLSCSSNLCFSIAAGVIGFSPYGGSNSFSVNDYGNVGLAMSLSGPVNSGGVLLSKYGDKDQPRLLYPNFTKSFTMYYATYPPTELIEGQTFVTSSPDGLCAMALTGTQMLVSTDSGKSYSLTNLTSTLPPFATLPAWEKPVVALASANAIFLRVVDGLHARTPNFVARRLTFLLRSRDLGHSWTPVISVQTWGQDITGVTCSDEKVCFAVKIDRYAKSTEIVKTVDGGDSWQSVWVEKSVLEVGNLKALGNVFAFLKQGCSDASASLVVTTDGGASWTTVDQPAGPECALDPSTLEIVRDYVIFTARVANPNVDGPTVTLSFKKA